MKNKELILSEYEYLLRVKEAYVRGNKRQHDKFFNLIKEDLRGKYLDNLDEKIERWVDITNHLYSKSSKPVEFYIQAKMLYRDGFFEASISMARSICEMICYDLLKLTKHPFGNDEKVEKVNFKILLKYAFENSNNFFEKTFKTLNNIYDIGTNYVHPKSKQNPKKDSRKCLTDLGSVIFEMYGVKSSDDLVGKTIQTAYANFPDICKCYHLLIDVFTTPEAALKDMTGKD